MSTRKRKLKGGKNTRPKGNRRGGNRSVMIVIPKDVPFPPRMRRTLQYDTFFVLNNAAVLAASNTYNCSTPSNLNGAVNVPGMSEMANQNSPQFGAGGGLYSSFRVQAVNVNLEFNNLDTAIAYRVIAVFTQEALATNGATTATNQGRFASNPNARTSCIGVSAGQSKGRLNVSSSLSHLFGANTFVNNDPFSCYALSASTTQQPTTPLYFVLLAIGTAVMVNGISVRARFSFDIEFYSRNDLTN